MNDRVHTHHRTAQERAKILEEMKPILLQHPEIVFAFVHGSFASESPFRDIDIAVFIDPATVPLDKAVGYEMDLSQRLEEATGFRFPVEVKVINEAPLPFRFRAVRGQLLLCRNEETMTDFMVDTARRYLDMAPLRRRSILEAMTSDTRY